MLFRSALALARGLPIVTTSANRHGTLPAATLAEARAALGRDARYLDGAAPQGEPSTVVRVTADGCGVLRAGAISEAELEASLGG